MLPGLEQGRNCAHNPLKTSPAHPLPTPQAFHLSQRVDSLGVLEAPSTDSAHHWGLTWHPRSLLCGLGVYVRGSCWKLAGPCPGDSVAPIGLPLTLLHLFLNLGQAWFWGK